MENNETALAEPTDIRAKESRTLFSDTILERKANRTDRLVTDYLRKPDRN